MHPEINFSPLLAYSNPSGVSPEQQQLSLFTFQSPQSPEKCEHIRVIFRFINLFTVAICRHNHGPLDCESNSSDYRYNHTITEQT